MKKNCNKIASSAPQKSTLMAGQSKISSFFSSKRSQVIKTQDINSNGVKEFDIITIENSPQKQNFGKDHPDKSLSLNVSSRKNEPPASQSSSATISHADQSLKGSQRISPSLLRPCSSIPKPSEDCDWNSESSDEIIGETPEKASIFNKLKMKSKIVHAENVNQKCRRSNNGPSKLSASNKSKLKSAISAKQDSLMNADQSCIPPFDSREKTLPNKRLADQPTGLSPNSKKCDQILSREVNIKSCQSSLLSRLNDVSEMQKSVPPPQVSHKGQLSPYSINIAPAIKNKSSSILMDVDETLVDILNEYGYGSNKNLKATSQESPHSEDNSSSKKTLPKINQSRVSEINSHNKIPNNSSPAQATDDAGNDISEIPEENDDTVQEKSTNQDPIADFMDDSELEYEKLACEMEFMSPFKFSAKSCEEIPQSKFVGELLSEGIGADSYCSAGNFGRHVVTSVKRDLYEPILRLSLLQLSSNCPKTCSLHGSWSESVLQEDDIVHILFCSEVNGHYSVTDQEGIVIINPDVLLSGTSIVAGCFCRRKATLAETFKGIDGCNQVMLVGSLVHQLFQDVVEKKQAVSSSELQSLLQALLQQSWVVRDMYGLGLTPQILHAEMSKFLPHIEQFLRNYMPSAASLSLKNGCPAIKPRQSVGLTRGWSGTIKQVLDCEENFWSPRFGLKGKVDLTLAVQDHLGDRVLPLELKTGRATFSSEHRGQLMLYTLMMTDRRPLPSGSGLLLYLRSGDMEEVTTGHLEKRELLQLRNEMASYFARPPAVQKDGKLALPSLPSPIDRERACQGCPHLLVCTALNTAPPSPPHAMASLVPATLAHLQPQLDWII
ncbi:DNA replication ATP-dependent helicase/nuclease JHS1 [Hyalella azteca]|uniref:DNA replication ATP-dependent helicase/nuclease JHS1 n=2 Tax=Hyalella azteca TaxID=294128 RepID=A0A8B7PLQ0_HYAAZ|nr:DNA replication ATP-dependent helicase/nuclease JHS1 [Hyalella azteca]